MKGYSNRHKGFKELDERFIVFAIVSVGTALLAPMIQRAMRQAGHHTTWFVVPLTFLFLLLAFVLYGVCIALFD